MATAGDAAYVARREDAGGETNDMCEPGILDRERQPHILAKVGFCIPLNVWSNMIHYNGTDAKLWMVLMFFFSPLFWLWGILMPYPAKEAGDNQSQGEENDCCAKGCYDRERPPPCIVKCCAGAQYQGWKSLPGILSGLPPFFGLSWINCFLTFDTLSAKSSVVGAPAAYGATGNSGAARASAAERGSRR